MKIAFAHWDQHIAPLFDTVRTIRLIETNTTGSIVTQHDESLPDEPLFLKIARLGELAVDTLVCGAISRPAHDMIAAHGIRVIPFVAGTLDDIIQAFLLDRLQQDRFAMPGCCSRWRRRTQWCGDKSSQEATRMNFFGSGQGGGQGRGQGDGKGRGQGGRGQGMAGRGGGRGRMGGPLAAGPAGSCVCPKCGHTEQHQRGLPCVERQCPKCGTAMVRQ